MKVLSEIVDFKCCMFNQTYRDQVMVRNSGRAAMKASISVLPELEGFLEFVPAFGYVQAGKEFHFNIKLMATPAVMKHCKKFIVDKELQVLSIPLRVCASPYIGSSALPEWVSTPPADYLLSCFGTRKACSI